jgi:protocatechuate 3,4-dioxygenase beta subunit
VGDHDRGDLSRRRLLEGAALVPVTLILAQCGDDDDETGARAATTAAATAGGAPLARTAACDDGDETEAQTEGPYYAPRTPGRRSLLYPGVSGVRLVLTGRVLDPQCRPRSGALLDFWQADGRGVYDNSGYRLRGHQFTDRDGRYRLTTVVPGLYTGRTCHIHVKVRPRGGDVLTTQLYFPGVARNRTDGIFDPSLLVQRFRRVSGGRRATFDFVV